MRSASDRTTAQLHAAAGPAVITNSPPAMTAIMSAAAPSRLGILTRASPCQAITSPIWRSAGAAGSRTHQLVVFGMVFEARI
jgi:hypothetical protein